MAIRILYVDVRDEKMIMEAFTVPWRSGMCASEAVEQALKKDTADRVIHDLYARSPEIIVAWNDEKFEEHSEVGGVGDLEWEIPDRSILTVVYENELTTEQQIDLSSDWMLRNAIVE